MANDINPLASAGGARRMWIELKRDKLALGAFFYLVALVALLIVGGPLLRELATGYDLGHRNVPPFSIDDGFEYVLGSDSLGRSVAARIVIGGTRTLGVAAATVAIAMVLGTLIGLVAGYRGGIVDSVAMRFADISLAFPGTLLAIVLLYVFSPHIGTVLVVLVINRLPIYIRVTRAEVLEIRERVFVAAARVLRASNFRIVRKHIAPLVVPTILTVATLDIAIVMLVESSLSFLGVGVQPPDISWGLMVAEGRRYMRVAWWLTVMPGVAIVLTSIAVNLLSNWLRVFLDPVQSALLHAEKPEAAAPEASS